jgi:hypothetical protein
MKLVESIKTFGNVQPLIVNKKNMTVISGHQRLDALIYLEHEQADCVLISLDDKKEKALNLAMNKISGEWDFTKLKGLLTEFSECNEFLSTGFEQIEFDNLLGKMSFDAFFGAEKNVKETAKKVSDEPSTPTSNDYHNPVEIPKAVEIRIEEEPKKVENDFRCPSCGRFMNKVEEVCVNTRKM